MNAVRKEAFTVSFGKAFHRLDYCSWKVGVFIIISKSEWDLVSLVVDMTANSAQWLPSVQFGHCGFLRSTKWNANLILTCGFREVVVL